MKDYFSRDFIRQTNKEFCTDIDPKILESNGFEKTIHTWPFPYYEYVNEYEQYVIGYGFPKDCNKTKFEYNFIYIDSKDCLCEHMPCKTVSEMNFLLNHAKINKRIKI